jgi:GDP-mannose 6-dehydrogenase
MKLSVFGLGYVGAVSSACLAKLGHQVIGVDISETKINLINDGRPPIVEDKIGDITSTVVTDGRLRAVSDTKAAVIDSDVSLVSVGTPSSLDGSVSLKAIDSVIEQIGQAIRSKSGCHTVVIRSTVLPGTTEDYIAPALTHASGREIGQDLNLCFNPEFLREGSSVRDFYNPPFTVIGSMTDDGFTILEGMYSEIDAPIVRTTCRIAESVKYVSNVYHAVKITFANEIGALLKSCELDAREAMEIFCQDGDLNISRAYLRPGFAFGGSCLPKDLRAILSLAKSNNIELPFLSSILRSNETHIERAFRLVTSRPRGNVAFFGLSYKAGTDDLRESPLVVLAERLIGRGYELSIVDKNIDIARLTGVNKEFIMREIPHLERLIVRDPVEAIASSDIVVICHADKEAVTAIMNNCENRLIVDLQGLKELQASSGAEYEGICW